MSVNIELLDPEHELSEANDTLIDILEKNSDHNNNDFIEGITHPSFKNSSRESCLIDQGLPGGVLSSLIFLGFKGDSTRGILARAACLLLDLVLYLISSGFKDIRL